MAERKSGPVKPPVIDLKARAAAAEPAAGKPADAAVVPPESAKSTGAKASGAKAAETKSEAAAKPTSQTARSEAATPAAQRPQTGDAGVAPSGSAAGGEQSPPRPDSAPPPPPPQPPRPQARLAMPWSAISIAAILGALLGAGLTYGLASWIALPTEGPGFSDPEPRLAALAQTTAEFGGRLESVEAEAAAARAELEAAIEQLAGRLSDFGAALEALRSEVEQVPAVDLAPLEEQLRNLRGRIDAVAAGASPADAEALARSLEEMESNLAALADQVGQHDQNFAQTEAALAELRQQVSAANAVIAPPGGTPGGGDVGSAVRLPLVVSGLEMAFLTGRPYAAELDSVRALLPDLVIPETIAEAAEQGLSRPDALSDRFAARLPQILAGRTATSSGDWTQDAADWARALLALRPAEETEGDSPEAVISRLEAAMERRDYVAAAALLEQLPEPMQQAAGDLAADIAAHAQAAQFTAALRAQALAPTAEAAQ